MNVLEWEEKGREREREREREGLIHIIFNKKKEWSYNQVKKCPNDFYETVIDFSV